MSAVLHVSICLLYKTEFHRPNENVLTSKKKSF